MTVHLSQVRLPQLNGRISEATATVTPYIHTCIYVGRPIPMIAWSNAWVCGRSLAGNAGSNPTVGMGVCLL
jgi:hypothetical protein